ncbi:hypothetical protein E2C01_090547 [Portunus trituberculatus]|uniref:Uncharacterized protein n=1 Tax=Portunus trituberculatus TaxID=210409 RepID=A0A5B7JEZ7_PORTR|nr:hypothetical protein [Portunus trituberculatus]
MLTLPSSSSSTFAILPHSAVHDRQHLRQASHADAKAPEHAHITRLS